MAGLPSDWLITCVAYVAIHNSGAPGMIQALGSTKGWCVFGTEIFTSNSAPEGEAGRYPRDHGSTLFNALVPWPVLVDWRRIIGLWLRSLRIGSAARRASRASATTVDSPKPI